MDEDEKDNRVAAERQSAAEGDNETSEQPTTADQPQKDVDNKPFAHVEGTPMVEVDAPENTKDHAEPVVKAAEVTEVVTEASEALEKPIVGPESVEVAPEAAESPETEHAAAVKAEYNEHQHQAVEKHKLVEKTESGHNDDDSSSDDVDDTTNPASEPDFYVCWHFLERFGKELDLPMEQLTLASMEKWLITRNYDPNSPWIELQRKLSIKSRIVKKANTTEKDFFIYARKNMDIEDGWKLDSRCYKSIDVPLKLQIFKSICERQFDGNVKFRGNELFKQSAENLRSKPLGCDKLGNAYWYTVDREATLRIFKEDIEENTWELVAENKEDFVELIRQLKEGATFEKKSKLSEANQEKKTDDDDGDYEGIRDTGPVPEDSAETSTANSLVPSGINSAVVSDIEESEAEMRIDEDTSSSTDTAKAKLADKTLDVSEPASESASAPATVDEKPAETAPVPPVNHPEEKGEKNGVTVPSDAIPSTVASSTAATHNNSQMKHSISNLVAPDPPTSSQPTSGRLKRPSATVEESPKDHENHPASKMVKEEEKDSVHDAISKSEEVGEAIIESTLKVIGRGSGAENEAGSQQIVGEAIEESVIFITGRGLGADCSKGNASVASGGDSNGIDHEDAPADDGAAPADDEAAPADDEAAPADDEGTTADDEGTTADDEGTTADDEGTTADDGAAPADDGTTPADNEGTLAEDEATPADDGTTPADNEGTLAEDEATPADDEAPPAEDETSSVQGSNKDENEDEPTPRRKSRAGRPPKGSKKVEDVGISVDKEFAGDSNDDEQEKPLSRRYSKRLEANRKAKQKFLEEQKEIERRVLEHEEEQKKTQKLANWLKGKKRRGDVTDEDYEVASSDTEQPKQRRRRSKKKSKRGKKNEFSKYSSGSSESESDDDESLLSHSDYIIGVTTDHEFSCESDVPAEEATPVQHARTAKKKLRGRKKNEVQTLEDGNERESACKGCNENDNPDLILLCDCENCENCRKSETSCYKSETGWHMSCLRPALLAVPEGKWYCPDCQHSMLLENLKEKFDEFEKLLLEREVEQKRKKEAEQKLEEENRQKRQQRLESVTEKVSDLIAKKSNRSIAGKEPRRRKRSEVDDDSDSETSSGAQSYSHSQTRRARKNVTYNTKEYDNMIKTAIAAEEGYDPTTAAQQESGGKNIDNLLENQPQAKAPVSRGKDISTILGEDYKDDEEDEDEDEEDEYDKEEAVLAPKLLKGKRKRKKKSLNALTDSEDDDGDSGSDFKASDDSFVEEDEDFEVDEDEFTDDSGETKSHQQPTRRSNRERKVLYDEDFVIDGSDSEDLELLRSSKKRRGRRYEAEWDSEDDDYSDASEYGRKKKSKSKKSSKKSSKRSRFFDSDEEDEDDLDLGDSDSSDFTGSRRSKKSKASGKNKNILSERTRGKKISYDWDEDSEEDQEDAKKESPKKAKKASSNSSDDYKEESEESEPEFDDDEGEEPDDDDNGGDAGESD